MNANLIKVLDEIEKEKGITKDILIENEIYDANGGVFSQGITDNYIKVLIPDLVGKQGQLVKVKLEKLCSDYIISKILLNK